MYCDNFMKFRNPTTKFKNNRKCDYTGWFLEHLISYVYPNSENVYLSNSKF